MNFFISPFYLLLGMPYRRPGSWAKQSTGQIPSLKSKTCPGIGYPPAHPKTFLARHTEFWGTRIVATRLSKHFALKVQGFIRVSQVSERREIIVPSVGSALTDIKCIATIFQPIEPIYGSKIGLI